MGSSKGEDACSLCGAAHGEAVALHQDGEGTSQTLAGKEEYTLLATTVTKSTHFSQRNVTRPSSEVGVEK